MQALIIWLTVARADEPQPSIPKCQERILASEGSARLAPPLAAPPELATMIPLASIMGRQLFRRDHATIIATDFLASTTGFGADPRNRGWLAVEGADGIHVLFIGEQDGATVGLYHVLVADDGRATMLFPGENAAPTSTLPLADDFLQMWHARSVAIASDFPKVAPSYNIDVAYVGSGITGGPEYWAYLLPATTDPDQIILGGFSTVIVAHATTLPWPTAPAAVITSSRSLLAQSRKQAAASAGPDSTLSAMFVTHLTTEFPLDVHVFTSLTYGMPLLLCTVHHVWRVSGSEISYLGPTQ